LVIWDTFSKVERQLKELTRRQREAEQTRNSAVNDTTALVTMIFHDEGYGFIRDLTGEEIYFHRNSLTHDEFDRIEVGTGVRYKAQSHFIRRMGKAGSVHFRIL
jgi:cold shock CspA family protein